MIFHTEKCLKAFAAEFNSRSKKGWTLPSSWNAFGHFMRYERSYAKPTLFTPLSCKDHLIDLLDFVDYASSSKAPDRQTGVRNLPADTVFAYQPIQGSGSYEVLMSGQPVIIQSIWMCRRHDNLFIGAMCGVGRDAEFMKKQYEITDMLPTSNAQARTGRNLPTPLFGKPLYQQHYYSVEIDLKTGLVGRQFVYEEYDKSLNVITNDSALQLGREVTEKLQDRLQEHGELFSVLVSAAKLPDYFAFKFERISQEKVAVGREIVKETKRVGGKRETRNVEKIVYKVVPAIRIIRLNENAVRSDDRRTFTPPKYKVEVVGHWRSLKNTTGIGHDQHGQPIVGITWVEAHERWKHQPDQPKVVLVKQPLSAVADKET